MKLHWHTGCSGFHYKHWKGVFYPDGLPQRLWFEHYCRHFRTLELNVTFYRFPKVLFLKSWHERSPEDFRFASKVPRAITHFKKLIGTTGMLNDYYGAVREGLQEKLGCVLFQFPPNVPYSEKFLQRIWDSLDPAFQNVVEFRHASWWQAEVYQRLAERNITFCGMSHPGLPKEIVTNTRFVYYRFHGDEQLYASLYSPDILREAAHHIAGVKSVEDAYIFFNNDIHGYAVTNAGQMQEIVAQLKAPEAEKD
ncbi:DUF72 domain-containing protein [Pedobacter sp. HMF7056]|uniref:DUF72 domain-containing protein n=2 Tax=Hufsiella ginkgonis TaxID=2695274 RepID=A0A7K1XZB9_9SPHI|nr:DUF72 domain-containing protein [Hufsiella ginkgonis]